MSEEKVMIIGSGNVFEDIGHPDPEKALTKAKLILRIATILEDRGLSQKDAAKLLHLSPKAFSSMIDGELFDEITIGQLTDYLAILGEHIEITVRHAQEGSAQLHVTLG